MKTNIQIAIGGRKKAWADEVIYLEAQTNYTMLYFKDGTRTIVATTLKILENRLAHSNMFFRSHRHFLINTSFITGMFEDRFELFNSKEVLLSRRKKLVWEEKCRF
jgi:DNA-binding LytR/AlgR family response regulator